MAYQHVNRKDDGGSTLAAAEIGLKGFQEYSNWEPECLMAEFRAYTTVSASMDIIPAIYSFLLLHLIFFCIFGIGVHAVLICARNLKNVHVSRGLVHPYP